MTDGWLWAGLFGAGLGLGLFFYGGLWWTVRRLPRVRRSAVWMLVSFAARLGATLGGLFLLMAGDWRRLVVVLTGFIVARILLVKRIRKRHAIQP